ncbi:MAG TPA: pyridoxal-dependent decarboxylase [Methylomirabilota bacterium]|jgi:aromatic-L-amino-acid decarboxylase
MSTLGDLPPDQARLWLHRVAGWVADYREAVHQQRVTPDVTPADIAAALPALPPEHGEKLSAIFEDLDRLIVPGLVHGTHPRCLSERDAAPATPGIFGEWLAVALGAGAPASPTAAALETTTLRWIRAALGLPDGLDGIVEHSPAAATLRVLAVARDAAYTDASRRGLVGGPMLMLYTSDEGYERVAPAAITLGLGTDCIRRVETDGEHRLRPAALRAAIARDVHARLRPLAVVATVGTPSCAAVDPVPAIADVCAHYKLWLHVDASHGSALAVLPEGRWVLDGVGRADSVVVNPSSWLFVPQDFSALYTRRPELLDAPARADRHGLPVLKAWVAMRALGRAGLEARIREHVRLARRFADWIEADPDFELMAPVTMAVVCFRARPAGMSDSQLDELNERLVAHATGSGRVYLTAVRVGGAAAMRVAIGNVMTAESHLADAWAVIHDAFDRTLVD